MGAQQSAFPEGSSRRILPFGDPREKGPDFEAGDEVLGDGLKPGWQMLFYCCYAESPHCTKIKQPLRNHFATAVFGIPRRATLPSKNRILIPRKHIVSMRKNIFVALVAVCLAVPGMATVEEGFNNYSTPSM
jgi:hypothetical protein